MTMTTLKALFLKLWAGVKWTWGKIKAASAFVVDFAKWLKARKNDGGAR